MYLTHLVVGLATPPPLRVDSSTWTGADWEVQQHLDDLEPTATACAREASWCGCPACPDGGDLHSGGDY